MANGNKIIAAVIVIAIMASLVYFIGVLPIQHANEMMDKGCRPLVAGQSGIPTAYECPIEPDDR